MYWFRSKDYRLEQIVRDDVVVTLKDGQTFRGLFDGADDGHLVLLNAEYLKPDGTTKVDGQVFLPRANVAYVQRP